MNTIKEKVLREFGDQGAETLVNYFVQIQYTTLWCIRMLNDMKGINAVIPEGVEDIVVIKPDGHELHQVKMRIESQGPWTLPDVLPIICKQYYHRKAFQNNKCSYHFVSNSLADNRTNHHDYPGSLFKLKHLLEIIHDGQTLSADESLQLDKFKQKLIPKIQEKLKENHSDHVDELIATEFLHNTWIETDSIDLRQEILLQELQFSLDQNDPNAHLYTTSQLQNICDRILLLVIQKILGTKSLQARKITKDDVLKCRVAPNIIGNINLENLPGESNLEKKTILGGFDITEVPFFNRQRKQADWTWRNLEVIGIGYDLERLTTVLLDLQNNCRHSVCRVQGVKEKPGPKILEMVRQQIPSIVSKIIPNQPYADEQFCLGILWNQTEQCFAWWQGFEKDKGDSYES